MRPITTARLVLALIAAGLIGYGIRTDNNALRWAGIGFLVAVLVLRFFGSKEKK